MPWLRMLLSNKIKIFVPVDEHLIPIQENGLVKFKYQLSQEQFYSSAASKITYISGQEAISDEKAEEMASKPKRTPKKSKSSVSSSVVELPPPPDFKTPLPPNTIVIYTDGGADPNPGEAASGVVLLFGHHALEIWEYLGKSTNNIAELTAILRALQNVKNKDVPILLYSDSAYSIGVLTGRMKPKTNLDLIAEIRSEMARCRSLQLLKVQAHVGIEHNERVDRLVAYARYVRESGSRRT